MHRSLDLPDAIQSAICVSDSEIIANYCQDWTGRVHGATDLLVRPRTHIEVAQLIRETRRQQMQVQVQGGNTSLAGGSIPLNGEILLSTERLKQIVVEPNSMTATVGAGVTLEDLQREIANHGLSFGVDIASRGSATLGGMAATNAGGIHVLRYGSMADNVIAMTCVFGDGSTIEPRQPLIKDATGPSLTRLLVGSEGIFGVITSVTLRLLALPQQRVAALTPLESIEEGVQISTQLRHLMPEVDAIEYLGPEAIALAPTNPPWNIADGGALLVQALMDAARFAEELSLLHLERQWILTDDTSRRQELWSWRERIPEWIATVGSPLKLDLSVPITRIGDLYRQAMAVASLTGITCYCFGHLGDGNLHVNLVGNNNELTAAAQALYQATLEFGGSISAEHGVGTLKKEALRLMRSPEELARLAALIEVLNPRRVVNPNVMLDIAQGEAHDTSPGME